MVGVEDNSRWRWLAFRQNSLGDSYERWADDAIAVAVCGDGSLVDQRDPSARIIAEVYTRFQRETSMEDLKEALYVRTTDLFRLIRGSDVRR